MKNTLISMAALAAFAASSSASAFWNDDEDWKCYGPYGKIPDCNPYDEWDPRYWMEEMEQVWDDDDDYYGGGYGGYGPMRGPMMGSPYGYGAPMMGAPYGAPMMGAPMPAPYGAPMMGAPMPAPMPAPYGAPMPPAPPVE